MSKRYVVEITGLPGVGKTTTTRKIQELLPHTMVSWSPRVYRIVKRLRLDKLFVLYTKIRFRKFFSTLRAECQDDTDRFNEIRAIVNRVTLLYGIAHCESVLRNVSVVIDDGYILRGLSVWLRAPVSNRDAIAKIYYESIPRDHVCCLIDCDLEEILTRSRERGSGHRSIFRSYDEEELQVVYQKMKKILAEQNNLSNMYTVGVHSDCSVDEQVKQIFETIKERVSIERLVTWDCC